MPEFVRTLTVEEAEAVRRLLRMRTIPAGVHQRALMVHWSAQGQTPVEIATRLEHKSDSVRRWIRRFNKEGLPGLEERPGRGRKPEFTKADALTVVETVLAPPG
jgi:transposase